MTLRQFPYLSTNRLLRVVLITMAVILGTASFVAAAPRYEAPRAARPVAIDGDLSDWRSGAPMVLGSAPAQVAHLPYWGGPLDLSAKGWVQWDRDFLYFAAEVTDNHVVMVQYDPFYIWGSDSIQIALDPRLDCAAEGYAQDDREYGWALVSGKSSTYCWQGTRAPGEMAEIESAIIINPDGHGWTLETAIPWEEIGIKPAVGLELGFSWLVNESDVEERDGWIEWSGGLGAEKSPTKFGRVVLAPFTEKPGGDNSYKPVTALWQAHWFAIKKEIGTAREGYKEIVEDADFTPETQPAFLGLLTILTMEDSDVNPAWREGLAILRNHSGSTEIGKAISWEVTEWVLRQESEARDIFSKAIMELLGATGGNQAGIGVVEGLVDSSDRRENRLTNDVLQDILKKAAEEFAGTELGEFATVKHARIKSDLLYREGKVKESAQALEHALTCAKPSKEDELMLSFRIGELYEQEGEFSKAVNWYRATLEAKEQWDRQRNNNLNSQKTEIDGWIIGTKLANALLVEGEGSEKSRKEVVEIIFDLIKQEQFDEKAVEAFNTLGSVLLALGDKEAAMEVWGLSLESFQPSETLAEISCKLGDLFLSLNYPVMAEKAYRRCLTCSETRYQAIGHERLGNLYESLGDSFLALREYEEAVRTDTTSPGAEKARIRINSIKGDAHD